MIDYYDIDTTISSWVKQNINETYFIIVGQQTRAPFVQFCKAVLIYDKIPVIITNVGSFNKPYSQQIRDAMKAAPSVRVYEVSKMAMTKTLMHKAKLFVKTNGGIIWTP